MNVNTVHKYSHNGPLTYVGNPKTNLILEENCTSGSGVSKCFERKHIGIPLPKSFRCANLLKKGKNTVKVSHSESYCSCHHEEQLCLLYEKVYEICYPNIGASKKERISHGFNTGVDLMNILAGFKIGVIIATGSLLTSQLKGIARLVKWLVCLDKYCISMTHTRRQVQIKKSHSKISLQECIFIVSLEFLLARVENEGVV